MFDETVVSTRSGNSPCRVIGWCQKGAHVRGGDRRFCWSGHPAGAGVREQETQGAGERGRYLAGALDLPLDVYNGMIPIIAKNMRGGGIVRI